MDNSFTSKASNSRSVFSEGRLESVLYKLKNKNKLADFNKDKDDLKKRNSILIGSSY
jgi:hypothetical protein